MLIELCAAMASEMNGMRIGGQGETVEAGGGYLGGYAKRPIIARAGAIIGWRRRYP